jgi:2-methylcitrate dehydratase PrpD
MNAPLISEKLARFAVEKAAKDIPGDVVRRAKYLFLDAIGIAFASTHFEFSKRAAMGLAGLGEGSSTVIGMPITLPLRDAALMNGTLVHGLDFDDTYLPGSMHLSASAIPNSLAVAASVKASGRDMLIAASIAMEVSARVAAGGKGWFQQAGFHTTGVAGIFGCALGTSRLWGMPLEQAITAQGIALSYASGSARPLQDGSWTKRIHPGIAASSSITAAALARQGYVGPKETYEGVFGLYPSYLGEYAKLADYPLVTEKLGEVWEFTRATIKLFPACHQTHAFVNAAIKLHNEGQFKPEDIVSIKALIAKQGVLMICEPLEVRKTPADAYSAQFSLPYQIARGLLNGSFGLTDLEGDALKHADTLKLAKIMEYEIDPNAGFPKFRTGEVVLTLKNGKEVRARENIMPDDPFSESEVERKFLSNASMVMSPARAAQVCDAIMNLEKEEDVSRFAKLLGSPR